MTLLQTLAKLWARWFCKYNHGDECYHDSLFDHELSEEIGMPFWYKHPCDGIKCKGCPL